MLDFRPNFGWLLGRTDNVARQYPDPACGETPWLVVTISQNTVQVNYVSAFIWANPPTSNPQGLDQDVTE